MLHSMMAFTGETFEPHLLQNAKHCALYFEEDGQFLLCHAQAWIHM